MGYSRGDSLDHTLYKDSDWKILWLSKKLSESQMDILTTKRFLPGVTPSLKWHESSKCISFENIIQLFIVYFLIRSRVNPNSFVGGSTNSTNFWQPCQVAWTALAECGPLLDSRVCLLIYLCRSFSEKTMYCGFRNCGGVKRDRDLLTVTSKIWGVMHSQYLVTVTWKITAQSHSKKNNLHK